eukprot:13760669-Alexandrium_andersonii.AAC.1
MCDREGEHLSSARARAALHDLSLLDGRGAQLGRREFNAKSLGGPAFKLEPRAGVVAFPPHALVGVVQQS